MAAHKCYAIGSKLPPTAAIDRPLVIWCVLHSNPPEKMRDLVLKLFVTALRRDCQVYELSACAHCAGPQEARMRQVCEGNYQPNAAPDVN